MVSKTPFWQRKWQAFKQAVQKKIPIASANTTTGGAASPAPPPPQKNIPRHLIILLGIIIVFWWVIFRNILPWATAHEERSSAVTLPSLILFAVLLAILSGLFFGLRLVFRSLIRTERKETGKPSDVSREKSGWPTLIKLAICALILWFVVTQPELTTNRAATPIQGTSSQPAPIVIPPALAPSRPPETLCTDRVGVNLSEDPTEEIEITEMHQDCFSGKFTIPDHWGEYKIKKSDNPGDWARAWCVGKPKPGPVHLAGEEFTDEFKNCHAFYIQGEGTVTLTKWTGR